jgi:hypothetical protein
MSRLRAVKTNFTAGTVSPLLLGRGDLRAYDNGALKLENLFIYPTGGLTRRAGLRFIDSVPNAGRIIAFEFNAEQTYLLVFSHLTIHVYLDGALVAGVPSPFTLTQIPQVAWSQSADTLILTHPDVAPVRLTRNSGGAWALQTLEFAYPPFYRFAASTLTISASATSGSVTLTASNAIFQSGHVNTLFRINGKRVRVTAVTSGTAATATVLETLTATGPQSVWDEQAFSAVRGWPVTAAFHQDRLVIGGTRDLPNRLFFSKSADLFNFDLGTGLDDDSIAFMLLSDQVNAIRGLYSGRHLQVFTSGAEWMVTGDPLTPATVQVTRQTRVGAVSNRYVPPLDVDGATIFVGRSGDELREFLYTDVEQAYQAADLSLLSREAVRGVIDQDFDAKRRLLFIIRQDGSFSTLTLYRAEQVTAWTTHDTDGLVKSVAVVGDDVYVLVHRDGGLTIECFEDELYLDAAIEGTDSGSPAIYWSGLDHLEGREVVVIADGVLRGKHLVTDGEIEISPGANHVLAGLPYTHTIMPLPPSQVSEEGSGLATRMIALSLRLQDTQIVRLDVGRGLSPLNLNNTLPDALPALVSGDVRVKSYGWTKSLYDGLWRIAQDDPVAFRLLSVTAEYKINA